MLTMQSGIPGVGKTTTAETLAMSLKRPLLRIDASDFNYEDTAQVSMTLQRYFHLAHSWGAILLL
jgi:ATP-dependent Clp protease ATP-binding subunit ClpA